MLSQFLTCVAVLLSLLWISGWVAQDLRQTRFGINYAPAQFNIAICFLLSSIALLMAHRRILLARIARGIAGIVLVFAALTLSQYAFLLEFGIDDLFSSLEPGDGATIPSRMAPATAMCFMLVSTAIATLTARSESGRAPVWALAFATATVLVGAQSLWANVFAPDPEILSPFIEIDPPVFALFALLVIAIVLARPYPRAIGPRGPEVLRIESYAAWTCALMGGVVFVFWLQVERNEWEDRGQRIGWARETASTHFMSALNGPANMLARIAENWRGDGTANGNGIGAPGDPLSVFPQAANAVLRDYPDVFAVSLRDADLAVLAQVASAVDAPTAATDAPDATPADAPLPEFALPVAGPVITPLFTDANGGDAVEIVVPVMRNAAPPSFLAGQMMGSTMLAAIYKPNLLEYSVLVSDGERAVGHPVPVVGSVANALMQEAQITVLGRDWTLRVWPNGTFLQNERNDLPQAVLLFGLLTIALLTGALLQVRASFVNRIVAEDLSDRLAGTLREMSDGFVLIDRDWRLSFINARAQELFSPIPAAQLGKSVFDLLPELIDTPIHAELLRTMEDRVPRRFETYFGPLARWLSASANPAPSGIAIYFNDITDQKRAELEMRSSEERFRLVAQTTSDVIWDYDATTQSIWWNDGVRSVFGHDPVDFRRNREVAEAYVHPDDLREMLAVIEHAITSGATYWVKEYRFQHADGRYLKVVNRGALIRDSKGKLLRLIGAMTDVTEQRDMQEQIKRSERLQAIGQLTGGVAHDFNNLLTILLGNAEMLVDRLHDQPDVRRLAETSLQAAERGAELTNRLLAFARRQPLEPRPCDLNAIIAGMDGLLRRSLTAEIEMELVRGGGLWTAEIDQGQFEVTILNLAINARDAMKGGGRLTIETANVHLSDHYAAAHEDVIPGQYVMVSVSDTGTGMSDDVIARAFEPFFTTKDVGEGSGLGLSLVYGFLKQSHGHVKIYSELGEGTTFRLYFPRYIENGVTATESVVTEPLLTGHELILVVEDDDMVRAHLLSQLATLGYDTIPAASGATAMDVLKARDDIDLLFTDVVMPGGMNGRELARQATKLRPNLRVLFTSGYAENAIVHHGRLDLGVQLLSKPYRQTELAAKLRKVLGD